MKSRESTLYIHIPSTPTLLVVVMCPSLIFTERTLSPPLIPAIAISLVDLVHCMSSYRKVTYESVPPVAMTTWKVFICHKQSIMVVILVIN